MEITAVEGEQDVGAGEGGAEDGFVLGDIEDQRPVEGEFVVFDDVLRAQREPCASGVGRFVGEVVAYFAEHPRRNDERPALCGGEIEDLARSAGRGKAGGEGDAAIEK